MLLRQIAISSLTVATCAGTIVLHVTQAALADTVSCVPTGENRETCVLLDENNKPIGKPWTRSTAKGKSVGKETKLTLLDMRVCTPDRDGGYNCTDSGTPLPPGTVVNPRITIVPRSERDPKLPTVDSRHADSGVLYACKTPVPAKGCRVIAIVPDPTAPCGIRVIIGCGENTEGEKAPLFAFNPFPFSVQDPSTPDGKNEPIYPGLPSAPRNTIVSQLVSDEVKPDPDKCPVVRIDENGKPFCA